MEPATGAKVVHALGETGGAIGLICGVLLVAILFLLRHLMQNFDVRNREFSKLNQDMQKTLVNNTAAMTTLAQILQHRRCLNDTKVKERINKVTNSINTDED